MKAFVTLTLMLPLIIAGCMPPPAAPPTALLLNIQSPNCSTVDNFLTYENDSIQVAYIFWAENGIVGLFIHNKLQQPLYVDWKKCSFITGTTKHDYWNDSFTVESTGSASSAYWQNFSGRGRQSTGSGSAGGFENTFWSSVTTVSKPERITFIPPGTTVSRTFTAISQAPIGQFDQSRLVVKDTTFNNMPTSELQTVNYEGTTYTVASDVIGPLQVRYSTITFTPENSPISFRSFLTYSTNDKFDREAYIDNFFYADRISILSLPAFNLINKGADGGQNIWATPSSFYTFENH